MRLIDETNHSTVIRILKRLWDKFVVYCNDRKWRDRTRCGL